MKIPILRSPIPCSRQREVGELLRLGHWPQACPQELLSHAESCRACGDLILVSLAVTEARAASVRTAALHAPGMISPGLLWWRAQLRRRNAALETLSKPIFGAQVFALAINLAIVVGIIAWRVVAGSQRVPSSPPVHSPEVTANGLHFEALWSFAAPGSGPSWTNHALTNLAKRTDWTAWLSSANSSSWTVLLPCMATLAILTGVVLYLATEKQ